MKRSRARRYIEFAVLFLLAVAILWWFGRSLNWAEVSAAVRQANWWLLGVAVVAISSVYLLRAFRWKALLRPLGDAGLAPLFEATTVGFAAVFLIGRAGEVVRPVVLPMREPRIRPSSSFVTILVERIYDMMAVILLFAANMLWFTPPATSGIDLSRVRIVGGVLLGMAIVGVIILTWYRKRSDLAIRMWKRFFENRWFVPVFVNRVVLSLMDQLARALRVLVDARELAVTVGWTALIWIGISVGNLLVIRAFGLPFGIGETVFVMGWALVASLVPTPGGAAGAFHAATAAALIVLGVTKETAAAISILMHLVDFGPAVIFGLFYFLRGDINISRLREMASPEAVEHAVEEEPLPANESMSETRKPTQEIEEGFAGS